MTCTFAMYQSANQPHGSWSCLCCRDNALFYSALKDCDSYYTTEERPYNMSFHNFVLYVQKQNLLKENDKGYR